MKTLLCILVTFAPLAVAQGQSWRWLYPSPTPARVKQQQFITQVFGFVITENGEIHRTEDGGKSWSSMAFNNTKFNAMRFLNVKSGYILGYESSPSNKNILLATTDGGVSFTRIALLASSNVTYTCMHFISSNEGYIAGSNGAVLRTLDGGSSWADISVSEAANMSIFSVYFADRNHGIVFGSISYGGGYNVVCGATSNGGTNWALQKSGIANNFSAAFHAGAGTHFLAGTNGIILKTQNSGRSWTFPSQSVLAALRGVSFTNEREGWAVGEDSTILKTTDGGESWEKLRLPFYTNYVDVGFLDGSIGLILGQEYRSGQTQCLLFTSDGGNTWSNRFKSFPTQETFTDVSFVSDNVGYIISSQKIYKTADAGYTWSQMYGTTNDYFNAVAFLDENSGWSVGRRGYSGALYRTTDGGLNWTTASPVSNYINSIHFVTDNYGWIAADGGKILRTRDGGRSPWVEQTTGITEDIYKIFFVDGDYGWAITKYKTLLSTTNGGGTWASATNSGSLTYRSVYFIDRNTGWLGTLSGLLKSTDGGRNWTVVPLPNASFDDVYDIYFRNSMDGYVLTQGYSSGDGGKIYKTTDGGASWLEVFSTSKYPYAFSFSSSGDGWMVGAAGTVASSTKRNPTFTGELPEANNTFRLGQNYPNPFSSSTTIEYELPVETYVHLSVYDIMGRLVYNAVNDYRKAGKHAAVIPTVDLNPGQYIYTIKTREYINSKTMFVLR